MDTVVPSHDGIADEVLARLVAEGDRAAWESLYLRHERELRFLVARSIADPHAVADLIQECYVELWRGIGNYDSSRPFLPWMRALCRHRAWEHRRKETRRLGRTTSAIDALLDPGAPAGTDEDLAEHAELHRRRLAALGACLENVDDERRDWLRLRYIEHLELTVIAERIGRTAAATAQAFKRLRDGLRRCCEQRLEAGP